MQLITLYEEEIFNFHAFCHAFQIEKGRFNYKQQFLLFVLEILVKYTFPKTFFHYRFSLCIFIHLTTCNKNKSNVPYVFKTIVLKINPIFTLQKLDINFVNDSLKWSNVDRCGG